ncbi:MAG TPA: CDP-alcohol phosphatidyltransferase family protein [Vicinamibacterales bacterium]|nr:CDP-alcohol phosphatidyltransferase family protein [Vicinamibacterales bacterium]
MSWQLPNAPLLGRVVIAEGVGLAVAVVVAWVVGPRIPVSGAYLTKSVAVFAAIAAIAIGHVSTHHPFPEFGAANIVTTIRAALVALTAALVGEARVDAVAWAAATLGVIVIVLDGFDGWLARRSAMCSPFGARYDLELDALLIAVLAVIAWQHGKAGAWVVLAGALRYLFVAAGYLWRWLDAPLPESRRRKAICVVQIVGLGIVVAPSVSLPASVAVAVITVTALAWSFGVDVLWLARHRT